jgi:hypothetical protein
MEVTKWLKPSDVPVRFRAVATAANIGRTFGADRGLSQWHAWIM